MKKCYYCVRDLYFSYGRLLCTDLNNLYIPSHFLHISYKLSISNSNVKLKRLVEEKDFVQIHTADK